MWSATCVVSILLVLVSPVCHAKIENVKLLRDERGVIVVTSPFGFTASGYIDVFVTMVQVHKDVDSDVEPDYSKMEFFLAPSSSETQVELDVAEGSCLVEDNPSYVKLFTLADVRAAKNADQDFTYANQFQVGVVLPNFEGGEMSLYFTNCVRGSVVTLDITVSMYNIKSAGRVDYLSVGEDALPVLFMALFVLFSIIAAMWGINLSVKRQITHRVHYLMLALVVLKALTLLSQAGMYQMISQKGHPRGWNVVFYIFTFLRGILFFTLIVLIGTGWSYMKPFIAEREKKILMVVIPLQVVANVAIIILDENTPAARSWYNWRVILHLVDIVCCCAVLFPIVWSIKHLRDASQTDGKAARSLLKLQLFRQFYVIVVCYIYFTRIVVYLLRSTMPYNLSWVSDAAGELATLAFYVITGIQFRPKQDNPYLVLDTDDEDSLHVELGTKGDD